MPSFSSHISQLHVGSVSRFMLQWSWRFYMKHFKFYVLLAVFMLILGLALFPGNKKSDTSTDALPTATSSDTEVNQANLAQSEDVQVHIIDIGQGDSILIQSDNDTILIDGGNKGKGDEVLAYLAEKGISTLTAVISTHPDADHIGGLATIIHEMNVESVYAPRVTHTTEAYKEFLQAVKMKSLKIKVAKKGVRIPTTTPHLELDFIGPTQDYSPTDLNNWSAVLMMTHGEKKFLLTGDIETAAENDLLHANVLQQVDVLKVSHHGAEEATNKNFLEVIKPKLAAISVGDNNRYQHPTTETLTRLKKVGAKIYRTDEHGSIIFVSNGKNIIVKVER